MRLSRLKEISSRLLPFLGAVTLVSATLVGAAPTSASSGPSTVVYNVNPPHSFAFTSVSPAGFPTPSQCVAAYGLTCYTPQEMRAAYDVPSNLTGAGQTIVIVDAYGSPTITQDLQTFDQTFGLPDPTLNIIYPGGKPTYRATNANQVGWAQETSLDVEWSHAMAPGATIDLVIAASNYGNVLNNAESYAVSNHLGNVMSMSFGAPEAAFNGNNGQMLQADAVYQAAASAGMSVFASAGDGGAGNGYATPNALFPASDPLVTSVGGTNLFMQDNGTYSNETVWNDADPTLCPFTCAYGAFGATGGATSDLFAAPSYQSALSGLSQRSTADVAYNASVYTAVMVFISMPGVPPGFYFFGGTSEGAPQWAAITALADEAAGHSLGAMNPRLYAIGANPAQYAQAFHDVTVGQNGFGSPGYSAGTGYDLPTGLGSPDVANLITILSSQP